MKKRIALVGVYHETNTFSEQPTTLDDFRNGYWLEKEAILGEYRGAHHEISGVIDVIENTEGFELVPVFYTYATPGGMIEARALETILDRMFHLLREAGNLDGVIVVPHGAGVSERHRDMDGYWLEELRRAVGEEMPITGTLDPHANVSPRMAAATDALFPYGTNPHVDQAETGRKAARLMVEILRDGKRVEQYLLQVRMAISIEQQYTSEEPCSGLLREAARIGSETGLEAIGLLLGFPYADVSEMGSAFLLVYEKGKGNWREAERLLLEHVETHITDFNGNKADMAQWLPRLGQVPKPALLLDMGDNVGGGGPGTSTFLLEALDKAGFPGTFICIHDPGAVSRAKSLLNGRGVLKIGAPGYEIAAVAVREVPGQFSETTPRHGGFVNYDMGETVIVSTETGQTVMLTSVRTVPYSLRQLTACGLDPGAFDFIVAKGVNAPIAAYRDVCKAFCKVDTPGVTSADMTRFTFRHRRKPLYPFEPFPAGPEADWT